MAPLEQITSIQRACEAVLHWEEYSGRHGGDRRSAEVLIGKGLGSTKKLLAHRFNTNHQYVQRMRNLYLRDPEAFERTRKGPCPLVYAVGVGEGPTKIGRSDDLVGRFSGLQAGHPYKLRVLTTIETPNHVQLETEIHERLSPRKLEHEWFDINEAEVSALFAEYRDSY